MPKDFRIKDSTGIILESFTSHMCEFGHIVKSEKKVEKDQLLAAVKTL